MKSKLVVCTLHFAIATLIGYFVEKAHSPFNTSFYLFWSSILLSFIFYLTASFSDPGYIQRQKPVPTTKADNVFHQQQSSFGSVLTATSHLNPVKQSQSEEMFAKIVPELLNQYSNYISESLNQQEDPSDSVSINLDVIPDQMSQEVELQIISEESVDKSQHVQSLRNGSDHREVKEENQKEHEGNKENINENYDMVYCTICFNDRPLRAKHCRQCNLCVAMYDHHCPFIGNCVGEKNKLAFFWYVFFQMLECAAACEIVYSSITQNADWNDWCRDNYQYLLLGFPPFFVGLLLFLLWMYHLILACRNVTTFEMIRWNDISYLGNLKTSPFSRGTLNNLSYFCRPCKGISLWKISKN